MTRNVRFIHASDVHMGAPIRGLLNIDADWSRRLQEAIPCAFDRVIDAALSRKVDFVVFSGDTVDTSRVSYGDYVRLFAGFEKLDAAGIPVYLVAGNHDPYTVWMRDVDRLPASARLLGIEGPEFALFSRDGESLCLIGARSYHNQTWSSDDDIASGITRAAAESALSGAGVRAADAPFSVGIIHTSLEFGAEKAPAKQAELLSSGMDYWACGHLHRRWAYPSEESARIAYSGCVQGRDMKEVGEHGCYLVELEKPEGAEGAPHSQATVRLEFIPTASVVFQQIEVQVGACRTLADVRRHIQAELFRANGKAHCDDMITRVCLVGSTELHDFLARRDVADELRKHVNNAYPSFFCDALVDRTKPVGAAVPDAGRDGLFSATVSGIAGEERAREDVLVNYVQNELVKRGIAVPASASLSIRDFEERAERLVFDQLREGDE